MGVRRQVIEPRNTIRLYYCISILYVIAARSIFLFAQSEHGFFKFSCKETLKRIAYSEKRGIPDDWDDSMKLTEK